MKSNVVLFVILTVFFFLADAVYITWSILDPVHTAKHWYEGVEWVGAVAIGLSGILSAFLAFYIGKVYKGQGGELPEDRDDADIDDGEAEQGFFSPWSWWPIMLALSAAIVFTGLAVGIWVSIIGAGIFVVSMLGWHFEYFRGYFVR